MNQLFEDRADAGRRLARELRKMKLRDPVVVALPRGGVPVAAEIARALRAPLDVLLVRKVGVPGQHAGDVAAVAEGRTVVLVDDGIATGVAVQAALLSLRSRLPDRIVLAVPVAPAAQVARFGAKVDALVCLLTPEPFVAIAAYYRHFNPITDEQVGALLASHARLNRRHHASSP